jgi:ABC-2 type transport system permease protein
MIRLLRIIWRRFILGLADCLEYRAEIMVWMFTSIWPLVMMFGWIAAAGSGTIQGYKADDFVRYFLAVFLIEQLTPVWVSSWLGRDIRLGALSPRLLLPSDPYWHYAAAHWGAVVVRLPVLVPLLVAAYYVSDTSVALTVFQMAAFTASVLMAWLIVFNIAYCLGLCAFWVHNVASLQPLYYTMTTIFGGSMVPLDILPPWAARLLTYTPFPSMTFIPARIFSGAADNVEIQLGLLSGLIWTVITTLAMRLLWRHGLRRYGAVGA